MALLENFKEIVKKFVEAKNIKLSSFAWDRIMRIGKGIKKGETKAGEVIRSLKEEKELRLNLSDSDWRQMEKMIARIL